MWKTPDIDDLQLLPSVRDLTGYAVNIRPALMAKDLEPFVVTPSSPARRFGDDMGIVPEAPASDRPGKLDFSNMSTARPVFAETVFLIFPDLAAARASTLGRWWSA